MLGENKPLDTRDSLLRFTLENRVMSHVQMRDMDVSYTGFYWVCAPVMNSAEQMIGMVVVERMPFLSINQETLQLFSVLLNFYADIVQHGPEVDELCIAWPGMPPVFGRELVALNGLARTESGFHPGAVQRRRQPAGPPDRGKPATRTAQPGRLLVGG